MIITIDGPTASGKSTVARLLAGKLSYYYLNSGLLYRALAYLLKPVLNNDLQKLPQLSVADIQVLLKNVRYSYDGKIGAQIYYDGNDITNMLKGPDSDYWASVIAVYEHVRDGITHIQRAIAHTHDLVVDGRDCGTRVFPHAAYKFFLTAALQVRAERWRKDQEKKGNLFSLQDSVALIHERDIRDTQRTIDPLMPARDAHIVDNSNLTIEETVNLLLKFLKTA